MASSTWPRCGLLAVILIAPAAPRVTRAASTPCRVRDLQAGTIATCMVLDSAAGAVPAGGAMCFGSWGQLGANVTANSPVPLPVVGLSSAGVSVATMQPASIHSASCAVFVGPSGWKQLRCTGQNDNGQLGCGFTGGNYNNGSILFQITPCDAVGLPTPNMVNQVKGVASGNGPTAQGYTVAWLEDGRVFIAIGQPNTIVNFTQVAGLSDVAYCVAGESHTCCLTKANNSVWCLGADNQYGQLGVAPGGASWTTPPVLVQISGVVQLAAGRSHNAALLSNGTVMSWGRNNVGQLGDGSTTNRFIPVLAVNLTDVAQVSAGGDSSCARLTNGNVRCWGSNAFGQVGASCGSCTTPQAPVPGVSGVASVTQGLYHVCVALQDKTASCWGFGLTGQLSGTTTNAAAPGRVVMCDEPGCPAPPPTGGATSITSYQSCSSTLVAGIYSQGTACTAICAAGTSGGFAKCGLLASGAPVWQVTSCAPVCNPAALPAVPHAEWSCGASVTAGGSCSGSCAAGFEGGLTAVCVGPSWSTTGSCTRVACIGPPPSGAPNATFQCASTPVGQPCVAVCAAGLTGSPRRVCFADGTWGALEGDACVNCADSQPKLTANQPSNSTAAGSIAVSAEFTFTAPFIKASTLLATLDGLTACATQPAQFTGAAPTPTPITVSCQVAGGISAGPHKIALTATTTGSNGCGSRSTTTLADILATSAPAPAPSVQLAAAGAAPFACKAAAGRPLTASATFTYVVAPATASDAASNLVLETEVAASADGAACTATTRSGGLERGTLEVTCRGVFDSLTSLGITVTLKASTPSSLQGSATSNQTVAFICCTPATTLAHAVNAGAGSDCQTCGGSASAVDGVWLKGALQVGVMRAGAISASTCSSASSADVGSITAVCDEQNSKLLRVAITNPAGSPAAKIEFLARCNIDTVTPNMPSCLSGGPYRWRTVTPARNSLNVTTGPSGEQVLSFSILQTSTQATCTCGTSFFAIKQTGAFSTGRPVNSSGSCTAAGAAVKGKAKAGRRI